MTKDEMRLCRREIINWHLQNKPYPLCKDYDPYFIHDITFMVRNSEVYRYGQELKAYQDTTTKGE